MDWSNNLGSAAVVGAGAWMLLLCQGAATFILLSRLIKGAVRRPPLTPLANADRSAVGSVSVVVPTLNEVDRIAPCLTGLGLQGDVVREILIVDSNSQDGTRELVKEAGETDSRLKLVTDDPLPAGWVGRPWALNYGFLASSPDSEWILGIDADTEPQPGLVASLVAAAVAEGYDLVSLSPQFILKYPGEWWLQPALLMTLLYRFDSSGVRAQSPDRVMANGQCFLCRRSVLVQLDGYTSAATSFCDDVTLARNAARQGFKVGFLDGAKVIRVRMYAGMAETWREWGRSLDLKDATTPAQLWSDVALLVLVQGLPLPLSIAFGVWGWEHASLSVRLAIDLNLFLVAIRFALLLAVYPSYYRARFSLAAGLFWLSPLADPLAVFRILLSAMKKPKQWRGRVY
ncbi:2'-O-glycosyltransferase CruG [Chamaesiphon sp. VAR_69_metabat_338]|uniref:2'-O-glycosyltransferase CruG n=1 Tax=Chamaesiphon sp. VAR_69_metabat_338 TaxID=2964704 RepID=UPI00286DD6EF|nr:glycosyltransferase family 2 protein [Chamaesiphon sp. VAR_69_metabat_338]